MKKILLLGLYCLCLCGCNSSSSEKLLIGEWTYFNKSGGEHEFSYFTFNNDNTFEYSTCFHYSYSEDGCSAGQAKWDGTYKLKNDIIILSIKNETQLIDRYGFDIIDPPSELIIDFDNMYFCDRNEGLDCKEKYEKDT